MNYLYVRFYGKEDELLKYYTIIRIDGDDFLRKNNIDVNIQEPFLEYEIFKESGVSFEEFGINIDFEKFYVSLIAKPPP